MSSSKSISFVKTGSKTLAFLFTAFLCASALAIDEAGPRIEAFSVDASANLNTIRFPVTAGTAYGLQRASLLLPEADWSTEDICLADADGTMVLTNGNPEGWMHTYYRIAKIPSSEAEALRARKIARMAMDAASQDYTEAIGQMLPNACELFLSGELSRPTDGNSSGISYGDTNLWPGAASDWLPERVRQNSVIDLDHVRDMEWIWVRDDANKSSRILGRYAYACFNLAGDVDANFIGLDHEENLPATGYGSQTNRNNVRRMLLDGVRESPNRDTFRQWMLSDYRTEAGGFDTFADINALSREGLATAYLTCYSRAAVHKGSGTVARMKCTTDNIKGSSLFGKIVKASGASASDVEKALKDYTSAGNVPLGTDYPSVKAVPMFNEVYAKLELLHEGNIPKLKLTLKVEFWYPFESQENAMETYTLKTPSVAMSGTTSSGDIVIRYRAVLEGGGIVWDTLMGDPEKSEVAVTANWNEGKPMSMSDEDALVYTFSFPDSVTQKVSQLMLDNIRIPRGLKLENGDGKTVDAMPYELRIPWALARPTLTPDAPTITADMEVIDPRLNHLATMWVWADEPSLGEMNEVAKRGQEQAKVKLGYDPAPSFYCRNGAMQTPAELGYLPVWNEQTPWMTLDIFSDEGIDLMNQLVCPAEADWDVLNECGVYYTNGTIHPYTTDQAVLNGAFYGLDLRVPGCKGTPDDNEVLGVGRTKELTEQLIKTTTPENNRFTKDGAAGWGRVLRYKGFNLNKNQRVALLHNTWGLFNESDGLFLVFVVAQTIAEAAETDDPVGSWNEQKDQITGERRAVALCWTDTSADVGQDFMAREPIIINFQFLDE